MNEGATRQHAGPAHAEHDRQKLVRQLQLIAIHAVLRHQEPARQPLLYLSAPVCHRCLIAGRGVHLPADRLREAIAKSVTLH